MVTTTLSTKLFIPPPRSKTISRDRLTERLNSGLHRKLTLISAPAGFGKTTLLSEWVTQCGRPVAWLSIDEDDSSPSRFLAYLFSALKRIAPHMDEGVLRILQSPQPPPLESVLTLLINEIAALPEVFILILDDYHQVDSEPIAYVLTFILRHMPPQMHLVISTREEPRLPLARLRARDALNELRPAELRFTAEETAAFFNQVMNLNLSPEHVSMLEHRTEGWIAGLQIAALAIKGQDDTPAVINSFTGSHRLIFDYLAEEILQQQPEDIQLFLLTTSFLDRFCIPLCNAVLPELSGSSRSVIDYLERANLFVVPLDSDRHWYRYHHLFEEFLRRRMVEQLAAAGSDPTSNLNEVHIRASEWYEANGYDIEAFRHAAAAHDTGRAERLVEGRGVPLHFRGAVTTIIDWLASLPASVLNARPSLWWLYASLLLINGQTTGVDEKLDAAKAVLNHLHSESEKRAFRGQLATARSVLALSRYQVETMREQSRLALDLLPAESLSMRAYANWTGGFASYLRGNRDDARRAYAEALQLSQKSGDTFTSLLATIGLGNIQEAEHQLHQAANTYKQVLQASGNQPLQIVHEAHLGLARIHYEWNSLQAAEHYGEQALLLARQYDQVIDRFIICEIFLARLKLAQGYAASASAILGRLLQITQQPSFEHRLAEIVALQVMVLLRQGHIEAADRLAHAHDLPLSQARVFLARDRAAEAISLLDTARGRAENHARLDESLRVVVLQAVAVYQHGHQAEAVHLITEALSEAESGGYVRLFIDEGAPITQLISEVAERGVLPHYTQTLLAALQAEHSLRTTDVSLPAGSAQQLVDPLTRREMEVLRLISRGLSNHEISQRLFVALSTVKGHNQRIFDKLGVQRRTEAIARARELGLL